MKWCISLKEELPSMLEDVPLVTSRRMYFQQDGFPVLHRRVKECFPNHWIGHGGPLTWPPRSLDLNPIVCSLWGHVKAVAERRFSRHETIAAPVQFATDAG